MAIVKSSWLNVLLICVPFGWVSHFFWSPTVTFVLNFVAIVPLAKLLGFVTEDIALRTGEVYYKYTSKMNNIYLHHILGDWWSTQCYIWKRRRTHH